MNLAQGPVDLFPAGSDFENLAAQIHSDLESRTADKAVCQDLLSKLAESGDPLLASRWLHKMRKCGVELDPGCYEAVVAANCLQGLAMEGEMIFEVHAKELASEGRHPSPASYGCLVETFAECGEVEKAQEYLKNMKSLNLPVEMRTYAAVIESLAQRGKSDAARRWLDDSITTGLTPSRQCFSATISAFAKESRLLEAEGVLKAMREASVDADVQTWGWLLMASHMPSSSRPNSRAKRKQSHTKPEDIFRQMLDAGIVPDSFALRALGKAVGLERREELCKEMGVDLSPVPSRPVRTWFEVWQSEWALAGGLGLKGGDPDWAKPSAAPCNVR
eukprot:s1075_g4.t1